MLIMMFLATPREISSMTSLVGDKEIRSSPVAVPTKDTSSPHLSLCCSLLCFCSDLSVNQHESWCRILFVPRENSRGHLCTVVLGARSGGPSQEKSLGCSLVRFPQQQSLRLPQPWQLSPRKGDDLDKICHSAQKTGPRGPFPGNLSWTPYPFLRNRPAKGTNLPSICPW